MSDRIKALEEQLNDFDYEVRKTALVTLVAMAEKGELSLPEPAEIANMHCHTFFSFNGYGYSPMAIAWLAKKLGIRLVGIVDFDVLDAVEEFLDACELAGVRGSAGLETRVYIPEFAAKEINSPGEPGISYHMGIGFTKNTIGGEGAEILADMRKRAEDRTKVMTQKINEYLAPVTVEYEKDVVPLTPNRNATERHLLTALVNVVEQQTKFPQAFWAEKLGLSLDEVHSLYANMPKMKDMIRKKLMKQGGVGYAQPGPSTFPGVDEVHQMILAAEALPCITWLDGTTDGEKDIIALVELLVAKGAAAVNIVPDRNWNIADPAVKATKVKNLYDFVELAKQYDLPINVGTEMNAYGLKLVDDFDASELAPVREAFLDGAYFIYGHTILKRYADLGYHSTWANQYLPTRKAKNEFYTTFGKKFEPIRENFEKIKRISEEFSPDKIISLI